MRPSFIRPLRDLSVIAAVAALLISKWCGATETITVCTRRPMLQGKVNETVLVCETITINPTTKKGG